MTDSMKRLFDVIFAAIGIMIASFGIAKYFIDQSNLRDGKILETTVSYIRQFYDGPDAQLNEKLFSFWENSATSLNFVTGDISEREYNGYILALMETVDNSSYIGILIYHKSVEYEKIYICVSAMLCDLPTVCAGLLPAIERDHLVYKPFFLYLNEKVHGTSIGLGLEKLRILCAPEVP